MIVRGSPGLSVRSLLRRVPLARTTVRALRRCLGAPSGPPNLRAVLAGLFLHGEGLEIGALHRPLPLPAGARARYVDRLPLPELRAHYPDLPALVPVDVVDDGERLATVADGSQDFLVANHFLEHTQNPIGTLRRFLEVLRPGGCLYLAVPDKRGTFDAPRPVTPWAHLLRDDEEGPEWSYRDHMYEYVWAVYGRQGEAARPQVEDFVRRGYSIHFHVWTHAHFWDFLAELRRSGRCRPFTVEALVYHEPLSESVAVLRRD